jgi:hypothetical protein
VFDVVPVVLEAKGHLVFDALVEDEPIRHCSARTLDTVARRRL